MSNQNAGYTVQPPAVAFAANLGSLRSNLRFYQQRGELSEDVISDINIGIYFLEVAVEKLEASE